MFKKYLFTSILCLGCLSFACSDDSNDTTTCPKECPNNCTNGVCNTTEETCETLSCNQAGGMEHACFTINGKAKCEIKCLTDKEGEHALCWQNPSLDQSIMHAITEACVKDDKGALYATIKKDDTCTSGCTQGVCDTTTECPEECPDNCTNGVCNDAPETCETLNCNQTGGMEHACFTINGEAKCEIKCQSDTAGEHALCWRNPSLDQSIMRAITEACVEDDNGALYATIKKDEECPIGCTQGVCDKVDICENDDSCLMNNYQDGRDYRCFTLSDGSKGCAPKCIAPEGGAPYAYACLTDAGTNKQSSIIDYCREDFSTGSQGIYSVLIESKECEHGCNEETGQCESILPDVDQTCATMNCEKDGGRPSACFTIDGKARCANTCLGDKEEEHTVCWASGSLGPNATPDSVTETCAKDDNDKLYVVGESTSTPCTNGCNVDTGQCNEASEP